MGSLRRFRSGIALLLILASLVFSLADGSGDVAAQRVSQGSRKVLVDGSDQDAKASISRQGGVLLVDYGTFSLWSVPEAQSAAIADRAVTSQVVSTVQDETD